MLKNLVRKFLGELLNVGKPGGTLKGLLENNLTNIIKMFGTNLCRLWTGSTPVAIFDGSPIAGLVAVIHQNNSDFSKQNNPNSD